MKIKNLFKRVIVSILIFPIIIISLASNVRAAETLTVDTNLLQSIFEGYILSEDYAKNGGTLQPGDTAQSVAENMVYTYGDWIIAEYNNLYAASTETDEVTKCEQALSQALEAVPGLSVVYVEGINTMVKLANVENVVNGTDNNTNNDTENTEPIETDSPLVVSDDYLIEIFTNYLTSQAGMGAATAEQTARAAVTKYGDAIRRAYAEAYNESTIADETERCEEALRQALAVIGNDFQSLQNAADGIISEADVNGEINETDGGSGVGGIIAAVGIGIGAFLNGIVGVFFYFVKLLPLMGARILMSIVGLAINGSDSVISGLSLDQILFNEVPILGINFFETATGTNASTINLIREQVSIWYVAIRNIAAVILAVMALYIGIRMAISSVAEEKARYQRMLTDWVVSIVLLFVLHYIMVFIININDGLVEVLKVARNNSTSSATVMNEAFGRALSFSDMFSFTSQLANMAIYVMLAVMTFIFFCTYVKRMVTIAFLIMISPLITVTYSIDRMGDGKSQALNTWFKNFVYNILLQPFQCITYLALVQTAINAMNIDDLSTIIVAIVMVFFLFEAEEIIKDIFHFQGKSVAQTIAQAALVTSAIGAVSKAASAGAGKVKGYASRGNPNTNQTPKTPQTGAGAAAGIQAATGAGGANGITAGAGGANGITAGAGTGAGATAAVASNVTAQSPSGNSAGASGNKGNKVLRTIGGAAKFGFKQAGKLPLAVMLAAAGLATGRVENAISGFNTGMDISRGVISGMEENANLRKFAKDYKNLAGQIYQGKDDAWIRDHTKALLDGSVQYQPYEKDYYDLVRGEQDRYIDSGFSADDAITQVEQNVAGVQRGNISEISSLQRFKGRIKNKFGTRP